MDSNVERLNKAQTAKWMHLPNAFTIDLVKELCGRDGVYSRQLRRGESFQYTAPSNAKLIIVEEGRNYG